MSTLTQAKTIYATADGPGKALLEKLWPKAKLTPPEPVLPTTFKEALASFKKMKFRDPLYLILQKRKVEELTAIDKLLIIARVLQGNWAANFANGDQKKWYAWFVWDKAKAAFVFSLAYCDYDISHSSVGSRLCFPDSKIAQYFGTQFLKEHNDYLTIKP